MRISSVKSRLLLGVGAAVLVAAPLATVAFAGTASAGPVPNGSVSCTKIVGDTQVATANLSFCTSGFTGGSGSITNYSLTSGDVAWANGTTTDYTATAKQAGKGCHASISKEYKITGTVTSSNNSNIPVGQVVKMKVCYEAQNEEVRNVNNTTINF